MFLTAAMRICQAPHRKPCAQRIGQANTAWTVVRRFRIAGITDTYLTIGRVKISVHQSQICPGSIQIKGSVEHTMRTNTGQFVVTPPSDPMIALLLSQAVAGHEVGGIRRSVYRIVHIQLGNNAAGIVFICHRRVEPCGQYLRPTTMSAERDVDICGKQLVKRLRNFHTGRWLHRYPCRLGLIGRHQRTATGITQ